MVVGRPDGDASLAGDVTGAPPPSDEPRSAVDWIEAAIPQHNGEQLAALCGAATIFVTGAAARTIRLGTGDLSAEIARDAPALVRWITQRGTWEDEGVQASGDEQLLAEHPVAARLVSRSCGQRQERTSVARAAQGSVRAAKQSNT